MNNQRISSSAVIGKNVILGENVEVGEQVVIKDGCFIGDNVVLCNNVYVDYDVIIRDNVTIKERGTIGAKCVLGEYLADFYDDRNNKCHPLLIYLLCLYQFANSFFPGIRLDFSNFFLPEQLFLISTLRYCYNLLL